MPKKKKSFAEKQKEALSKKHERDASERTSPLIQHIDAEPKFKVAAILSTHNSEKFMRGCLEDLIQQTLYKKKELEIIVIDSGSKEDEQTIVNEFQQKYNNIKYIRTAARETIYTAWNRGIRKAHSKYITNTNTDDRHREDSFEKMSSILDKNSDIGLVYADAIITATENETFEEHTPVGIFRWWDYSRELLTLCCFIGPQPMWRRSLHDEYGYFDESFSSSGDWEFWLRLAEGTKMLHIPEYLGLYLSSPQSAERQNPAKKKGEDLQIYQKYIPRYLSTIENIEKGLTSVYLEMGRELHDKASLDFAKDRLMQLKAKLKR